MTDDEITAACIAAAAELGEDWGVVCMDLAMVFGDVSHWRSRAWVCNSFVVNGLTAEAYGATPSEALTAAIKTAAGECAKVLARAAAIEGGIRT
jgi:hypothetical protein